MTALRVGVLHWKNLAIFFQIVNSYFSHIISFWKEDLSGDGAYSHTDSNVGEWREKFDSKRWNENLWDKGQWMRYERYDWNKYARCAKCCCHCFSGDASFLTKVCRVAFSAAVACKSLRLSWTFVGVLHSLPAALYTNIVHAPFFRYPTISSPFIIFLHFSMLGKHWLIYRVFFCFVLLDLYAPAQRSAGRSASVASYAACRGSLTFDDRS